jgi:predicted dehydrogenase
MKVWLVGAGYWGSKVKAELDTISGVSEVEVLDIKEGKTIDDIDTLDPVILATPLWQHAEQTTELLSRGHDVYVEKPMGENAQDIEHIAKVVGDRVLMVGHIFLYNPLLITLKKLIVNGDLGKIRHVESRRLNWGIRQTQTTPLLSLAPHDVSIINYLIGRQTVTYASSANLSNNVVPDMVEFGGAEFNCKVSWWWPKRERIVTVIGEKAQAVWDEDLKTVTVHSGHMDGKYPVKEVAVDTVPYSGPSPLHNELAHFIECCEQRKQPRTDVYSALRVAKTLDQVNLLLK